MFRIAASPATGNKCTNNQNRRCIVGRTPLLCTDFNQVRVLIIHTKHNRHGVPLSASKCRFFCRERSSRLRGVMMIILVRFDLTRLNEVDNYAHISQHTRPKWNGIDSASDECKHKCQIQITTIQQISTPHLPSIYIYTKQSNLFYNTSHQRRAMLHFCTV